MNQKLFNNNNNNNIPTIYLSPIINSSSPAKSNYNTDPSMMLFNLSSPVKLNRSISEYSNNITVPTTNTNFTSPLNSPVPSPSIQMNTCNSLPTSPPLLSSSPSMSSSQAKSNNLNSSLTSSPSINSQVCFLPRCTLCERGQPPLLLKTPTWASIMRVVFYCLHQYHQDKEYFSLKTDVYDFMTSHWDKLYINKKRSDNWRKQVQDMLSHSKNVFESGLEKVKQNGYWRLKHMHDPWVVRNEDYSPTGSNNSSPGPSRKRSIDIDNSNNGKKLKSSGNSFSLVPSSDESSGSSSPMLIERSSRSNSIDNNFTEDMRSIREEISKLYQLIPQIREKISFEKHNFQFHQQHNETPKTKKFNEELNEILLKLTVLEGKLKFIEDKSSLHILPNPNPNPNNNNSNNSNNFIFINKTNNQQQQPIISNLNINNNLKISSSSIHSLINDEMNEDKYLPIPNQLYNRKSIHPYYNNFNNNIKSNYQNEDEQYTNLKNNFLSKSLISPIPTIPNLGLQRDIYSSAN